MKVSSPNKPVQTITNKIKRGEISFKHKLQRPEGVWNKPQKSLLIDSLIRGYLINPTYTGIEDKKQYVIDGVQRLSTIYSYINDEFALSRGLDPVEIDGEMYEISGKRFSKLDEKLQDEFKSAQVCICEITEYTDKDVREMFRRINSGKALNSMQKLTPDMSDELSLTMSKIIAHPFIQKNLTDAQLKSSVDLSIALETLMLSEMSAEYDFGSFKKSDRDKFVHYYNDKVNNAKVKLILKCLDKLDEEFGESVKIPQTSFSMILYSGYRTLKDNKSFSKFVILLKDFLDNYEYNEEYKAFVQQGTSSAESVKARLDYWRGKIRELSKKDIEVQKAIAIINENIENADNSVDDSEVKEESTENDNLIIEEPSLDMSETEESNLSENNTETL